MVLFPANGLSSPFQFLAEGIDILWSAINALCSLQENKREGFSRQREVLVATWKGDLTSSKEQDKQRHTSLVMSTPSLPTSELIASLLHKYQLK